ncbi:DNA helicase MCM9 [Portunus trituberculatus]|uniref:DNA helicase MCM9 n=1 Tax=Portunus trituberculatus TaxID=210409 RepID=A0A5B7JU81_PORTR|nr:DNA helicase MCM9 [Portunus trituberculatus]
MAVMQDVFCLVDVFESFFLKHHREDLMEILEEEQDVEQHYPVFVKCVRVEVDRIENRIGGNLTCYQGTSDCWLVLTGPNDLPIPTLHCSFLTMFEEHTEVAESLLTAPAKLLPVLDLSLFRAATKLLGELKESCSKLSMKTNLHARITGEDKAGK